MQTITLQLVGASALLLHSDRGSDPLNPDTIKHKVLTDKKKKTHDDHREIAKSEYLLGFYRGEGIVIPSTNIKSSIVQGGTLHKLGMALKRGFMILDDVIPIDHNGPSSREDLWNTDANRDVRSVVIGQRRIMRYRPKLNEWRLTFSAFYDETQIDRQQLLKAVDNAGRYIGIGDYRPAKGGIFGRFEVREVPA